MGMAMSEDGWVPPSMGQQAFERLTSIEAGFPEYMRGQVNGWVYAAASSDYGFDVSVPQMLSLRLKTQYPSSAPYFQGFIDAMSDTSLVNTIDCMIWPGRYAFWT